MKIITLKFEVAAGTCCALCNPVSLADFETTCVRVRRVDDLTGAGMHLCRECVRALARGHRSGEPTLLIVEPAIAALVDQLENPKPSGMH